MPPFDFPGISGLYLRPLFSTVIVRTSNRLSPEILGLPGPGSKAYKTFFIAFCHFLLKSRLELEVQSHLLLWLD